MQNKIYLILGALGIIIVILLLSIIFPLVNNIKRLAAEFDQKNNLLASYKEKAESYLGQLRSDYFKLAPEISKINDSFVSPEKVIDSILAVERAAALTNNYQEIKEVKEDGALSFQVSLWGSFPNLIKFLARIENLNYFVDSESLQITRVGERELVNLEGKGIMVKGGDVRSVINIKAYTK